MNTKVKKWCIRNEFMELHFIERYDKGEANLLKKKSRRCMAEYPFQANHIGAPSWNSLSTSNGFYVSGCFSSLKHAQNFLSPHTPELARQVFLKRPPTFKMKMKRKRYQKWGHGCADAVDNANTDGFIPDRTVYSH